MKTLLVQDYLRSGKTLEDLVLEHGVYSKITNGKIALSYDQLEAKNTDPIACECRGLVLEENTYNVVACPMFRFFNDSQIDLTPKNFDWDSARMQNKCDGTLGIFYFYQDKWHIGTRSRCEADVNIDSLDITFAGLTDLAIKEMYKKYGPTDSLFKKEVNIQDFMFCLGGRFNKAKDYTFCFEITSPYNRIVCKYNDVRLTLLMVRNNITFIEEDPKLWLNKGTDLFGLKTPEEFHFNNIEHMIEFVRNSNPEDTEGLVVVDKNFNRIKVKSPQYMAFSKMRDSLSTSIKGCVEVILLGKDDDVVGMMPTFIADRIRKLKPVIQFVMHKAEEEYANIKHIDNMKNFASQAELTIWPSAMYALKRNKTPNLHTWALGNKPEVSKIPSSAVETMLSMCEAVDPSIKELKLALSPI
jgi:hypothetical protein